MIKRDEVTLIMLRTVERDKVSEARFSNFWILDLLQNYSLENNKFSTFVSGYENFERRHFIFCLVDRNFLNKYPKVRQFFFIN